MKQTPVSFHSFTYGRGKRAFCPVLQRNAAIDPVHSSACPPLSFSTGALYSRKVTLEGEEVSLQIQDTPCVALQVTNGGTEKAHRCCVSQLNTWMEKVNVGGRDMMTKRCRQVGHMGSRGLTSNQPDSPKSSRYCVITKPAIIYLVRNAFEVRGSSSPMMNLMSATCHMAHPTVYKTKASDAHFLHWGKITVGKGSPLWKDDEPPRD